MAAERGLRLRMVSAYDTPRADRHRSGAAAPGAAQSAGQRGEIHRRPAAWSCACWPAPRQAGCGSRLPIPGRGIDEADRDRLFQEFERLDAVPSVEGAGLGLAIAARIVTLMGGEIGYIPNPGGGSVFWFELPPADRVAAASRSPAAEPRPRHGVVHRQARAAGG